MKTTVLFIFPGPYLSENNLVVLQTVFGITRHLPWPSENVPSRSPWSHRVLSAWNEGKRIECPILDGDLNKWNENKDRKSKTCDEIENGSYEIKYLVNNEPVTVDAILCLGTLCQARKSLKSNIKWRRSEFGIYIRIEFFLIVDSRSDDLNGTEWLQERHVLSYLDALVLSIE